MSKKHRTITCNSWAQLTGEIRKFEVRLEPGEHHWFRGARQSDFTLAPTLMRLTEGLSDADHDQAESDLFFIFQAHAAELRERNLDDWDYLVYSPHYGVPTRVLDWTDTLFVALYFALEDWTPASPHEPALWVLAPCSLNAENWGVRDIILPRYLGYDENIADYWSLSEILALEAGDDERWEAKNPVAVYPIQLTSRARAQRGWFTVHGSSRKPLEELNPGDVLQLKLGRACAEEARCLLDQAGYNPYLIYQDLDHLAQHAIAHVNRWLKTRPAMPAPAPKRRK